ncbi:MAG: trypsin-like serine protease [Pseudomonadota bacterium]
MWAFALALAAPAIAQTPPISHREHFTSPAASIAQAVPAPSPTNVPDTSSPVRDAVAVLAGCAVTLIAPDVVITAGHCLNPKWRTAAPSAHMGQACPRMQQQAQLQGHGWEEPLRWYPYASTRDVQFGNLSDAPLHKVRPIAYAAPRCADMALLRLSAPIPPDIAVPLPILTEVGPRGELPRGRALRHVGWGGYPDDPSPSAIRGTGPVEYWGENECVIVAVPPLRRDGKRLSSGDSGGPLLMKENGEEIVAGVLFVIGQPDRETCGTIHPRPRQQHGSWTPTFRDDIRGTLATPIGAWLRAMVPEADHR